MEGKALVTGGAGYISTHTMVQLLEAGFSMVIFDNHSNSVRSVIDRVEELTGKSFEFILGDTLDRSALLTTFENYSISSVIHFAGLKTVGE